MKFLIILLSSLITFAYGSKPFRTWLEHKEYHGKNYSIIEDAKRQNIFKQHAKLITQRKV